MLPAAERPSVADEGHTETKTSSSSECLQRTRRSHLSVQKPSMPKCSRRPRGPASRSWSSKAGGRQGSGESLKTELALDIIRSIDNWSQSLSEFSLINHP